MPQPCICPYRTLTRYLEVTESLCKTQTVLITTTYLTEVSGPTLVRWTREVMEASGIDVSYFKPYSVCSASTSKQEEMTGNLDIVLQMGNWRKSSTFFKFYLREVKYFSRTNKNKAITSTARTSCVLPHIPASPLRKKAKFYLAKARQKLLGRPCKVPYVEDAPGDQGYDKHDDNVTIVFGLQLPPQLLPLQVQ